MNEPQTLLLPLPEELPDEAVAKLLEVVYELARAIENRYADQLHRYFSPPDDDQLDLWGDPHDCPQIRRYREPANQPHQCDPWPDQDPPF